MARITAVFVTLVLLAPAAQAAPAPADPAPRPRAAASRDATPLGAPAARPAPPHRVQTAPAPPHRVRTAPAPRTLVRRYRPLPKERTWHLRIATRSINLFVRESSYDVFDRDDLLTRAEVGVGWEMRLLGGALVAAEVGYSGGAARGHVLEDLDTHLVHDTLLLGGFIGYRLWDAVTPYARGGFALTWLKGTVSGDGVSMGGRDLGLGGYVFAGVELGLPRRWLWHALHTTAFTLALTVEAGYADLGEFHLGVGLSQEGLVDEYSSALGTLRMRGAAVNAGLVLSF